MTRAVALSVALALGACDHAASARDASASTRVRYCGFPAVARRICSGYLDGDRELPCVACIDAAECVSGTGTLLYYCADADAAGDCLDARCLRLRPRDSAD